MVKAGSSINGNAHTVVNAAEIATMPLELRAFFVENSLVKQRVVKSTDPKFFNPKKSKAAKPASSEHYSFYMKKSKFDEAVKLLDPTYWSDRNKWLKYTTACHALGHLDVWDKNNQLHPNNYGTYDRNLATWNSINPVYHESALKGIVPGFEAKHFKFKKTLPDKIQPDVVIGGGPDGKLGYELLQPDTNYVIQSDTGTGKTTSFKQYLKDTGMNFISIVSRVSLGQEQFHVIAKEGIDTRFYKNVNNQFHQGDNCITTIESIHHLMDLDVGEHVLFLDEFNSLIEHLHTSTTLQNNRCTSYMALVSPAAERVSAGDMCRRRHVGQVP